MKIGFEGKLYFCAAGIGGTPTWTELTKVQNCTLNLSKGKADATTRANDGWKAGKGTLKEATISFNMPWDVDAPGFTALRASYLNGTLLGIACMDGDITDGDTNGLIADMEVMTFNRNEQLEESMQLEVELEPTYSDNAPEWQS